MNRESEQLRTIGIKPKTFNKLKAKGVMGETWDDLLNRLCDAKEKKENSTKAGYEEAL